MSSEAERIILLGDDQKSVINKLVLMKLIRQRYKSQISTLLISKGDIR